MILKFNKTVLKASVVITLAFSLLIGACKKDITNKTPLTGDFNKTEMLNSIASNSLLPAYNDLINQLVLLEQKALLLKDTVNTTLLANLQNQFKLSYLSYEKVEAFEIGPAENQFFRTNSNTFPTDTTVIEQNITAGTWDLNAATNLDAKGFPALDYLLFGYTDIVEKYTLHINATNRINYLIAVIIELKQKAQAIYTGWTASGGNYIATFSSATGSDVGSSISLLTNQLTFQIELIKNAKLGIPLGKKTLGTTLPEKAEGYYSQYELELLTENLQALYRIYLGNNLAGTEGKGLDDYIDFLGTSYNGSSLNTAIKNQFELAISKINAIPKPLSSALNNHKPSCEEAYTEIQKLVVIIKNDLASALGIQITYQDSDGD